MSEPLNTLPEGPSEHELRRDIETAVSGLDGGVGDYRMEMPVELWFGVHRIGVKRGSPTCDAFLRYANQLLADFKSNRPHAD